MTKRKLISIVVGLVVVIAAGAWFTLRSRGESTPPFRTAEVRRGTLESTVTSTGKLNAQRTVAVGTQVSGRITELYADYNDRVREGDLIARMDPVIQEQQVRNAEANLERVRAALLQAEREYERGKVLFAQQVITEMESQQIEYDLTVARSNLASSEVSLEQARQNLSYTEIYAPINGIVVERNVEPGQTVAASMSAPQLYLLASDLREIEILATVDESDISSIWNGMEVRFTVQAYPTTNFIGTVRQVRLSSTTQENVVNYTAVISVQN
ncbi:MAG: efflux RND transporter periplasmic adaptor subunit, partial [Gemmatimonadota bacterium]|nr:efflux RND transporter periplasmic adaptor subunit [Gemmatimonadota bacterium]